MSRRVVITGMGVLSPIGNSVSQFYEGLRLGQNGIGDITLFDTTEFTVKIAGEVKIDLNEHIEKKELNRIDRFSALALIAADQAVEQSGINNAPDLEQFLKVMILSPRSITSDFNFPEWNYYGRGSGKNGIQSDYVEQQVNLK